MSAREHPLIGASRLCPLLALLLAAVLCMAPTVLAEGPTGKFPALWARRDNSASKPAEPPARNLPPAQAATACITAAQELIAAGHPREATLLLERARQLDGNQRTVARTLAVLYDQQGQDSQADVEYRRALELSPRDPELLADYGYFHYLRGDFAAAEAAAHQALEIAPQHARAWGNLGLALARQGRHHEAFEAFRHAVGEAGAHANMGMLLAQTGDHVQAQRALATALELEPNLPAARAMLQHLAGRGGPLP